MRRGGATLTALLAATALVAALAACGDSGGPSVSGSAAASIDEEGAAEEIEAVAERFDEIVAERDTRAFCRALAPSAVQRLGGGETDGQKECLAVWGPARNPLFRAKADPELTVESVSFEGGYATAKLANGGELGFSHEDGRWHVNLAPGPGQAAKR